MRSGVNLVLACCAILATQAAPRIALAGASEAQPAESRWVPSFAITSGVTVQRVSGSQSSIEFDTGDPSTAVQLRSPLSDDDRGVSPYVGGALELMSPALPLPTRPRLFVAGEFLPTFAPERSLASDSDPSRIRGPEPGAVLAGEEDSSHYTSDPRFGSGARTTGYGADTANGQGMRLISQVDQFAYGAKAGIAFGFQWRGRQFRIKPSAGWIHYDIDAKGYLVHPTCTPSAPPAGETTCTPVYTGPEGTTLKPPPDGDGFLRESIISGSDSGTFDGIGPGIDLEMDTARFGPIGAALFVGIHAYYIPGDRDIAFDASATFNDRFGADTQTAQWESHVAPWIYRAGVGIRFQWLGSAE